MIRYEICTVALYFGSDICQINTGIYTGQPQKCSENARCLTVISCPDNLFDLITAQIYFLYTSLTFLLSRHLFSTHVPIEVRSKNFSDREALLIIWSGGIPNTSMILYT